MIHHNNPDRSQERSKAKEMSLKEVNNTIAIINLKKFSAEENATIQKLIDYFQNLEHYKCYTQGLWVSDSENSEKFQLKFSD